jgi:hypothetical protein
MSEEKINQEAFKKAEAELFDHKVDVVKELMLETLEKIEKKKKEKELLDEELRILKLDIEDLRKGDFKKIDERVQKSKVARGISITLPRELFVPGNYTYYPGTENMGYTTTWNDATCGTYTTTNKVYYF